MVIKENKIEPLRVLPSFSIRIILLTRVAAMGFFLPAGFLLVGCLLVGCLLAPRPLVAQTTRTYKMAVSVEFYHNEILVMTDIETCAYDGFVFKAIGA